MGTNRKAFIQQIGVGLMTAHLPAISFANGELNSDCNADDFADNVNGDDEKYWKKIAQKYYRVAKDYVNLENGYYGIQPRPILQAFQKNITYINSEGSRFARKIYPEKIIHRPTI